MLKGEVKVLCQDHFDICKLSERDKELKDVWSHIEKMRIQSSETKRKTQHLPQSCQDNTRLIYSLQRRFRRRLECARKIRYN